MIKKHVSITGTFENSYAFEDYLHKNCFPRCNTTSYTTAPTYGAMLRSQIQDPFVGPKHLVPLIKKLCDRSSSDIEIQVMRKEIRLN